MRWHLAMICCIVICLILSLTYSHFPTDVSFPLNTNNPNQSFGDWRRKSFAGWVNTVGVRTTECTVWSMKLNFMFCLLLKTLPLALCWLSVHNTTLVLCLTGLFSGDNFRLRRVLHRDSKEPLEDCWLQGLLQAEALPVTQPTLSTHWRNKTVITNNNNNINLMSGCWFVGGDDLTGALHD